MAIIRIRVLEVLGATIERLCPALAGLVRSGAAEHPKKQVWPTLTITPASWKFYPDQDYDVWSEPGDSRAVFNVGRHEALLQLSIATRNQRQRHELEHAVAQVFVAQEGRPGILVVRIADCDNALVAYEMDDAAWQD